MDDIVVRLRKWSISTHAVPASDIMDEAADEIERLRRIVAMWVDCAFKTKDLYGDVFVPRASTYDGGVNRIVSGEWSEPKVSTGRTGNQWFTIPEPPGGTVTEPMLKERRAEVSDTNHDAAPAATADLPDERPPHAVSVNGGTPCAASRDGSGTGDISKAEIDALQHVVEDGRIVKMQDYGALRSLLVRLRPEWEDEDDSDRSQPINDERLAALEELSALEQKLELEYGLTGNPMIKAQVNNHPVSYAKNDENHVLYDTKSPRNGALSGCETVPDPDSRVWETPCTPQTNATPTQGSVQADGSVQDSRNANEPVAWLVKGVEYDTGCEYEYVTLLKEKAEIAAENGGNVIPLFGGPHTWQEEVAAVEDAFERSGVEPTWPDDEPGNIGPMAAAMADEIARLREAIRRLADQDATLSVQGGNVNVQMDATPEILAQLSQRGGPLVPFDPPQPTLTDAELEAVEWCIFQQATPQRIAVTLRGLLERLGGER